MKLIRKLLFWPFAQRKVDAAVVNDFRNIFETKLKRFGVPDEFASSEQLQARLVQEAYLRAGTVEVDGVPTYSKMWEHVENIAEKIAVIAQGHNSGDPILASIWRQHFENKGYDH